MNRPTQPAVALITGAAKRIGAAIAQQLHGEGMNVVIHYHHSASEARQLCDQLNHLRAKSAAVVCADLNDSTQVKPLIEQAAKFWGRLDVLVNNASSFFPTPLTTATEDQWHDLINSNLKAPFFLAQAAANYLKAAKGCIINITDIHGQKPITHYPIYCVAKAGLMMLTQALAKELAPEVRVNAVSPSVILWATQQENAPTEAQKQGIIEQTLLKQQGSPQDIAKTVRFLVCEASYITGQVIAVDGGRFLDGTL